jgi:zinc/manganese transport system substrate-binding protein
VSPLAAALGLRLITPAGFLTAISQGVDPSPADIATINDQIAHHRIRVYIVNSQNATPDVAAQVAAVRRAGIPVSAMTETLLPAGARFQDWQATQLEALQAAMARTGGTPAP